MNVLNGIKAVIFDLDGTLADSMWMWESIDFEYLSRFQISLPKDLQPVIEGMSFSETAVYFKERFLIPDSLEKIKNDWNQMAWEKYENEVTLKEGVLEVLKYLKKNHIVTGIASSNSRELVNLFLEKQKIISYFDTIRTSCEVEKGKPSPDIYLLAAKNLKMAPMECLVFEDIVPGILAGKSAGMQVCAVFDLYSLPTEEEKRKLADYYINSFKELEWKG